MGLKIAICICLLGIAKSSIPAAPLLASPVLAKISDDTVDPNPSYSFAYDVQDALTGDSKGQVESRANGIVQGQYNVAEPDGTRRIVDYTADPVNGFNAIVRKTPQVVAAPIVAKAASVVAAPAPVLARAAPVVAAPVAPLLSRAAPFVAAPAAPLLAGPALARVAAPFFGTPAVNYAVYST